MIDPFSAAASAAGIVTLGLQVCKGLTTYCRDWKSHDKNIEEAIEKITELERTLQTLADILLVTEDIDNSTTNSLQLACHKIYSCTANLNRLHSSLIEIQSISKPAGLLDTVHNVRLRSMSSFSKGKFKGLQGSIAETQSNIGSATQILQLHLTIQSNVALKDLTTAYEAGNHQMPETVERVVVNHFDEQGHRIRMLHQDVLSTSSQHAQALMQQTQMMKQATQDIAALQLGMMQKPSLVHAAFQEERRMQSQKWNPYPRSSQRCTCRALYKYNPLGRSWSYKKRTGLTPARMNAGTFASTLVHRQDCELFCKNQATKQFGLRLSFSGQLIQGAVQAAMSITRGSGGFSISPTLTFNYIVPSRTGPFKILDFCFDHKTSAADMQITFEFRKQELLRLYQEDKASPSDVEENGRTVMHEACRIFRNSSVLPIMDSNIFEVYFNFLRDLSEMGVPLNIGDAEGLTPLCELAQMYNSGYGIGEYEKLLTLMTIKMVGLGAELPILPPNYLIARDSYATLTGREFALCQDLAEAFGCNEVSQAIQAKDIPWLVGAIRRNPELINQSNILGQTPLHFSVYWPAGMHLLLEAGAAVNPIDNAGLTPIFYAAKLCLQEPFNILAKQSSVLNRPSCLYPDRVSGSILQDAMKKESDEEDITYRTDISIEDAEAMVDAIIKLVAERRRTLGALVRTSLDAHDAKRLRMSPEAVLDHKAPLAISMLRGKIDVPASLEILLPLDGTMYHIQDLNLRQAYVLWENGFHDVNELDNLGHNPLMKSRYWGLRNQLGLAEWLIRKGADIRCRQTHAFRKRMANECDDPGDKHESLAKSSEASSTTALHYLGSYWGPDLISLETKQQTINHIREVRASSETNERMLRTVLTDPLSDCCDCACSSEGCRAYTMSVKSLVLEVWQSDDFSIAHARKRVLYLTHALAQIFHVDQPNLAWLRREMVRFNTFERLKLSHTCCREGYYKRNHVIFEPYDEEERLEIQEEQAERLKKLEILLDEFEEEYNKSNSSFSELLDGYWEDRMAEVTREELPVHHDALENLGVRLQRTSRTSSELSEDEEDEEDELEDSEVLDELSDNDDTSES